MDQKGEEIFGSNKSDAMNEAKTIYDKRNTKPRRLSMSIIITHATREHFPCDGNDLNKKNEMNQEYIYYISTKSKWFMKQSDPQERKI